MYSGFPRVVKFDPVKATVVKGAVIEKNATLEATFGLPGFATDTETVAAVEISTAKIVAFNCVSLTNCVVSACPLQLTIAPETNPAPFTVSVKPGPPGAALAGTNGRSINGTGLDCAKTHALAQRKRKKRQDFMAPLSEYGRRRDLPAMQGFAEARIFLCSGSGVKMQEFATSRVGREAKIAGKSKRPHGAAF
jgi:hypothetical protein